MGLWRLWAVATAVGCVGLVLAGGARAEPGRSAVRLVVTYRGSGSWHTVYHSEPSNPGGRHDTNDANDSSRQRWALRFTAPLTVRSCAGSAGCGVPTTLVGATGATSATGSIDHTHVDGLYAFDNVSERCAVAAATPRGAQVPAAISVRYLPRRKAMSLTALSPVDEALTLLPTACPGQGDAIDGLANNYFIPGLSGDSAYGPDRWFRSAAVVVPIAVLDRARRIRIRLADTSAGTPPANCAAPQPFYETCRTGGSWSGTLELTALRN